MSERLLTPTQTVAIHVLPLIEELRDENSPELAADYRMLCRRSGALLRQAGLAPFLANLFSNQSRSPAHGRLLDHLRHGCIELSVASAAEARDGVSLLSLARATDDVRYIELTRATLLLLRWHKRFAEALLLPGDSGRGLATEGKKTPADARRSVGFQGDVFQVGDHAGLALAKFVPFLGQKPKANGAPKEESRNRWLNEIVAHAPSQHCRAAYDRALASYRRALPLLSHTDADARFEAAAASRLLVGFGAKGALEFGLCIHPTFGVPFIPGSALKGVAAAYAASVDGESWPRQRSPGSQSEDLFGSVALSGLVDFLDAWWVPHNPSDRPFEFEIVNPHYSTYLRDGSRSPDGMESPVPFKFLAVAAGTRFLFALRGGSAEDRCTARDLLQRALSGVGVGAKTSLGYGRFAPPFAPA